MRTLIVALIAGASLFSIYTTTRTGSAAVQTRGALDLEAMLDEALAEHPAVSASRDTRFKVSGSIVRRERGEVDGRPSYRCEVSLILTERESGTVRALMNGRASGSGAKLEELEPKVVRTAVRGALRRLDSLDLGS